MTFSISRGQAVRHILQWRWIAPAGIRSYPQSVFAIYPDLHFPLVPSVSLPADGKSDVIVKVGRYEITRLDFESKRLLDSLLSDTYPEKDSLLALIISKVLDIEADRRKIVVSEDEINTYIENYKNSITNTSFDAEYFNDYIIARGITREEFIEEEIAKITEAAPDMLRRSKVQEVVETERKEKFFGQDSDTNQKIMTDKEYYEDYKQQLLKKAKIKFYDKELEKLFLK